MAGFSTDVHLCYDLDIWREVLHSHFFAYLDNCKGSIEYRIRWRNVSWPFCFLDGRRGTTSTCTCLFSVFHSCFFWFNNCCVCGRLVSTKVHTRSVIFPKIYASYFFLSLWQLKSNIWMLLVLSFSSLWQISKGLLDKYGPDRVLDTPITEVINPQIDHHCPFISCQVDPITFSYWSYLFWFRLASLALVLVPPTMVFDLL